MANNINTQKSIKSLLKNLTVTGTNGTSFAGGSGGIALGQGSSIFGEKFAFNSNVKKYEVYEINEDLLALSVCWKRLRQESLRHNISTVIDDTLFREVNNLDRDYARQIRDYYSKKFMVLKLKDHTFTNYRQDLNDFVHSDGTKFKENIMPLAYRLPDFYEYDISFDEIAYDYNREIKGNNIFEENTRELSFIQKLVKKNRSVKIQEYWMHDIDNNLVRLGIDLHNPLASLLEKSLNKPLNLTCKFSKRKRDNQEYLNLEKYVFV